MGLPEFLTWTIGGGGAAIIAYWLMERVPFFVDLSPERKRYASLAMAGIVAMAAFGLSVAAGYRESPADLQAWLEALFAIVAVAIGGSQTIHGRQKLRV